MFLGRFFPERKVGGVPLFIVDLHPRAGLLFFQVEPGELAVAVEFLNVEINAVRSLVGIAFLHQPDDEVEHLLNVFGRPGDDLRMGDREQVDIPHKHLGVVGRNFFG